MCPMIKLTLMLETFKKEVLYVFNQTEFDASLSFSAKKHACNKVIHSIFDQPASRKQEDSKN